MENANKSFIENYGSILLLLLGIIIGCLIGIFAKDIVPYIKPLGDIFLNLLFVSIIPLIFFAISSSVANIEGNQRLGRIMGVMAAVFLITIILAAISMIIVLKLFPIEQVVSSDPTATSPLMDNKESWGDRIVRFLTVGEFSNLLSRQSMLAFVIFSFMVGIAARKADEKAKSFIAFLNAGNEVMKNLLIMIMKLAPVGLGAYFAFQVYDLGPKLFDIYAKPMGIYYGYGIIYFFLFFTIYTFIANGRKGVSSYWKNNILPTFTALSTCSSLATMPVNLSASPKMGIPPSVANVVIPLGTTLHKHGSALSSILKIYVAFVLMGWNFFDPATLITAVGITVLVSIVAGGIPNGGYIGEMLMISVYGLPTEAIPAVMIIGTLVDPLATVLNATGDTMAAMLVARFSGEKFTNQELQ
ncbi:transporter, dicarboxylate/amino acid:cation Na+/H+ symporter family protein [Sphingobacterium spiritivorum ATCC 33300]|uniref:Transporter, dicarboxylate/amino acid:cation Na+/H+ symporter family protein n=1 Tax=Sphingobacterium spiritivorum ATCC 33300 TaxID=525372 RepID=C2FWM6_SPHSI|nr:dicarboxylate/amino acid:cation symporter [Sphingobacterium spiritivorum]EEI92640.1 transporter, dicarboxylate/amino acid:cation Na+/H+ symporter family protein [Sphingobacterium spiritivorum ATCC 33300]QQS94169.1 dicarboxylate/amino acid:cation symporter [Sphingobacterium spiritivorum]